MYQQHMIGRSTEFSSKRKTTEIARLERMNHRDARESFARPQVSEAHSIQRRNDTFYI